MKKYVRYQCDTCKKQTDVINDTTHAFIHKCELTKNCSGVLRFVEEKNTKENILNVDFDTQQKQSSIVKEEKVQLPDYVSLTTSENNEFVIAVKRLSNSTAITGSISIDFLEIQEKEVKYEEYQFNLPVPALLISGRDNSISQKVLVFSETDEITVLINGEIVAPGEYVASGNIIRFNNQITYDTYKSTSLFVRVLVSSATSAVKKTLTFSKNANHRISGSWENVKNISIGSSIYDIYICDSITHIGVNSRLIKDSLKLNGNDFNTEVLFLLAKEPFTTIDRILTRLIKFNELIDVTTHIKCVIINKRKTLSATAKSLKDIYPAIAIRDVFSLTAEYEEFDFSSTGVDTDTNKKIENTNKFVLGPI